MGNCQAAEAATVVILHPSNSRIQRIYRSDVTAHQLMTWNPGHYVAVVVVVPSDDSGGAPVKKLKLLRPNDALLIGQVYRLISFQELLREVGAIKCVKLENLLKQRGMEVIDHTIRTSVNSTSNTAINATGSVKEEEEEEQEVVQKVGNNGSNNRRSRMRRKHQWKPALHSIAEVVGNR